jgi:hypothetical protein
MKRPLIAAALLLAGCGRNLVERTYATHGQSEPERVVDTRDCWKWATRQGRRMPQAADVALTNGILNAIVGAGVGAAVGAAVGHAGEGAKIGTAYSGTVGFAEGLAATTLLGPGENPLWVSQAEWGRRFYRACVTARGYAIGEE